MVKIEHLPHRAVRAKQVMCKVLTDRQSECLVSANHCSDLLSILRFTEIPKNFTFFFSL